MNIGSLLPHGPRRVFVMGERAVRREDATPEDIAQMASLTDALCVRSHRSRNDARRPLTAALAGICVGHIRTNSTRHNESNHPPPVGNASPGGRSARYDTGQTIHIFDGTI